MLVILYCRIFWNIFLIILNRLKRTAKLHPKRWDHQVTPIEHSQFDVPLFGDLTV